HSASLLANGKALITGGFYEVINGNQTTYFYQASAELFDPAGNGGGGGVIQCNQNGDCMSNHCVDGVCCDTACAGECDACNVGGKAGTCTVVVQGTVGAPPCTPYVCDGANATCPMSCNSDANCAG